MRERRRKQLASGGVPASDCGIDRRQDHPQFRTHLTGRESQTSIAEGAQSCIPFSINLMLFQFRVLLSIDLDDEMVPDHEVDSEVGSELDLCSQSDSDAMQSESHHRLPVGT